MYPSERPILNLLWTSPREDVLRYQALLGQVDNALALCCQHASGQLDSRQDPRLQVLIQAARR